MEHLVTRMKTLTRFIKIVWRTTSHTTSTMQKPKKILHVYRISALFGCARFIRMLPFDDSIRAVLLD